MKKAFKLIGVILILALAAYGAYSLVVKSVSYIRYERQLSSISALEKIQVGAAPVPNIILSAPDGNKITLYDELKNKDFVILSFGSIYCDNCHKEYRALESADMLKKVPSNSAFFLVVPEGRAFIEQFEKDLNIHLPIYVIDKDVPAKLGISKIPTIVLIGKDKKIKMYQVGYKESALEDMFQYIKKNAKH